MTIDHGSIPVASQPERGKGTTLRQIHNELAEEREGIAMTDDQCDEGVSPGAPG